LCDQGIGIIIFLPGENSRFAASRRLGHALANAILFECRADVERVALLREDEGEKAFAVSPTDAGEVVERGSAGEGYGVDLVCTHQGAGTVEAGFAFGERDGLGFGAPAAEGGKSRGDDRSRSGVPGPVQCGCGRGCEEQAAAGQHKTVIARIGSSQVA
jgi:hypothetical protein